MVAFGAGHLRQQIRQRQQILKADSRATSAHDDERIGRSRVGPRGGQMLQATLVVVDIDPVFTPGLPIIQQGKGPTEERVERMRHADGSCRTVHHVCI